MPDEVDPDATESSLNARYRELTEAIQAYVSESMNGGVVTDWTLSVERSDGAVTSLLVFMSKTMTAWKATGFATWTYKRLNSIAQAVLDAGA